MRSFLEPVYMKEYLTAFMREFEGFYWYMMYDPIRTEDHK